MLAFSRLGRIPLAATAEAWSQGYIIG
jgi:hypothetical protein